MNIIIVNPYYKPFLIGGAEHSMLIMACRLKKAGFNVAIVANAYDQRPRTFIDREVTIHLIPTPISVDDDGLIYDENYLLSDEYESNLGALITREVAEDNFENTWAIANNAQAYCAVSKISEKFPGIRTVGIVRDAQILCPYGQCMENMHPSRAHPCDTVTSILSCGLKFHLDRTPLSIRQYPGLLYTVFVAAQKRRKLRNAIRLMTKVVTISDALDIILKKIDGFKHVKTKRIYNFPSEPSVDDNDHDIKTLFELFELKPKQYLLIAGKKSWGKGTDVAVSAWKMKEKNVNLKMVVVGKGQQEQGVVDVCDVPHQDSQVLLQLLHKSLALIIPGRCQEGLHRTKVEAIQAGIPIICTEPGGSSEGVIDGKNGYVIPSNDPVALLSSVDQIFHWTVGQWDECLRVSEEIYQNNFAAEVLLMRWKEILQESSDG